MSLLSIDQFFDENDFSSELSELTEESYEVSRNSISDASDSAKSGHESESEISRLKGQVGRPKKRPEFIIMNKDSFFDSGSF